ncbi:unnamed protein product [Calypogeia fissa]
MDEGTSSSSQISCRPLNDSLYELHRPLGTPRMQLLFFHGFQLGDYEGAHLSTWKSGDGSCIWPQTWLVEEFPDAHILSVSYHASLMKRRESANIDLFIIAENILSDLLQANIGQGIGCQVILVGHSFGGLVIKEVCLHAHKKGSVGNSQHEIFLKSVKGLFFYATPHHGIASKLSERFVQQGPLLEYVKTLSKGAARLNDDFEKLLKFSNNWRTGGVGENLPMKWSVLEKFVVVEEASSRYGDEFRIVLDADHISICRPMKKTSTSFNTLTRFLGGFSDISRIPGNFQHLPKSMVGVADVLEEMKQYLGSAATLGLVGMGGIGKSTLAKALFNDLEHYYEYTCFLKDVKNRTEEIEDLVLENIHFRGKNNTQEGGKYLCQKSEVIWEQVVQALDKAEAVAGFDEKLWAKLRLSYDGLDKEEQEMFLEAATFFYNRRLDIAKAAWSMSSSGFQDMRWQHLVDLSLVWETPYLDRLGIPEIYVGMHEQLLCLGRKLAGDLGESGGRISIHCKDLLALAQLCDEDNIQDIVCLKLSIPGDESGDDTFEYAYEGEGDNERFVQQGPLLEYVKTLSKGAARLNDAFDKLLHFSNNWQTGGVGENLPMKWSVLDKFVVVEEASSRYGDNFRIVLDADHISICRPMKKTSTSFNTLTRFLGGFSDISRIPGNFQHLPKSIVGVDHVLEEMKQYLRSAATLGLVGMGGIGKTTLAKALFNDLECYYEYSCFLRDVKSRTQKVEDLVLENIHFGGKNNTQGGGLGHLSGRLLLLVLDDVASAEDLEILSVLRDDYLIHPDSQVLVTSRDSELLISEHLDRVQKVSVLSPNVSKQLLLMYAFPKGIHSSFERYIDTIVKKCGGLPLTLEVIGKYLCQKSEVIWEQVVQALDKAEAVAGFDEKLWAKLRLSYDGLHKEEQEMFLEAATMFYGQRLDDAKAVWSMSTSGFQDIRWQHLVDLSLVWELSGRDGKGAATMFVGMHEQLLSLGRKLAGILGASGGRIYVHCKDQLALAQLCDEDNIQDIVCLELSIAGDDTFEDAYAGEGDNAKVSSTTSATHSNGNRTAAKNFTTLFLGLKRFLTCTPKEQYADGAARQHRHSEIGFDLKSSKALHFDAACDECQMYPIEGPRFKSRVTLDYDLCLSCLQTTGSNASEYICFDQPAELGGQQLSIPGSKLCKMGKLRYLRLGNVDIDQTHSASPILPSTLVYLSLGLANFFELPFNPSHHKLMAVLYLDCCPELHTLPTNFGQLSSLQMLYICAPQLESLPGSFGQLPMLKNLEIYGCSRLAKLPETLGDLVALEQLRLVSCNALSALPESVGRLTRLRDLDITRCCRLFQLPETFLQLQGLECILLLNTYLHSVPNLENLRSLKTLRVKWGDTAKFPQLPGCLQEVISEQNYVHYLQFKFSDGQFLPAELRALHNTRQIARRSKSAARPITSPCPSQHGNMPPPNWNTGP